MVNPKKVADRVGFEPTIGVNLCRFSRPVLSTTQAPVRQVEHTDLFKIWKIESYRTVLRMVCNSNASVWRAERVLEGIWTRIVQSLMGQGYSLFLSRCKPTFFYSSTFHRIDTCLNMFPWFAWDTDRRERPNLSGLRTGTDKEPLLVHYTWNILCFVFASTPYCIYRLGFGFSFFRGVGLCPLPRQSKFTKIYRIRINPHFSF